MRTDNNFADDNNFAEDDNFAEEEDDLPDSLSDVVVSDAVSWASGLLISVNGGPQRGELSWADGSSMAGLLGTTSSNPLPHFLDGLGVVGLYNELSESVNEGRDDGLVHLERRGVRVVGAGEVG